MSETKSRQCPHCAPEAYRGEEARPVPLSSGRDARTTSDLTDILMGQLDGVLNDTVPLAKASTAARLSSAVLNAVKLECVYGPLEHRRKAMALSSTRAT